MVIMPFRCRTFAVKSRAAVSKTLMDLLAWVGINLGGSAKSPGAFNISSRQMFLSMKRRSRALVLLPLSALLPFHSYSPGQFSRPAYRLPHQTWHRHTK
eukprot:3926276-Pleurochrysis_carterae.AAC.2